MFPYQNMDTKRGRWMALGHLLLTCLIMMAFGLNQSEDAGAASPTPNGPYVVIDQSDNWYTLYDENGNVVWSEGMIDNPEFLEPGTYTVPEYDPETKLEPKKEVNSDLSGIWILNNFTRIVDGIGFHEIPIDSRTGYRMHSPEILGTNMAESHGCIRVSVQGAALIWQYIWPGDTVIVVE